MTWIEYGKRWQLLDPLLTYWDGLYLYPDGQTAAGTQLWRIVFIGRDGTVLNPVEVKQPTVAYPRTRWTFEAAKRNAERFVRENLPTYS